MGFIFSSFWVGKAWLTLVCRAWWKQYFTRLGLATKRTVASAWSFGTLSCCVWLPYWRDSVDRSCKDMERRSPNRAHPSRCPHQVASVVTELSCILQKSPNASWILPSDLLQPHSTQTHPPPHPLWPSPQTPGEHMRKHMPIYVLEITFTSQALTFHKVNPIAKKRHGIFNCLPLGNQGS